MFKADYHTHSLFSPDGHDGIPAMLAAAEAAGLDELCITDHCDTWASDFPAAERYQAYREAKAQNGTGVKLLLGVELGEGILDETLYDKATACPVDFIIGSHHVLRGGKDFYALRHTSEGQCHQLLRQYFDELAETAEWGRFDVMGHIGYPLRYMRRDGFDINLLPRYEDELRALFAVLVPKGLGVELNLGGPRPEEVFSLYRQCGGEIVTVGSDAHRASAVGAKIADGIALLRAAGFSRIAAFEQREVRYEKI